MLPEFQCLLYMCPNRAERKETQQEQGCRTLSCVKVLSKNCCFALYAENGFTLLNYLNISDTQVKDTFLCVENEDLW